MSNFANLIAAARHLADNSLTTSGEPVSTSLGQKAVNSSETDVPAPVQEHASLSSSRIPTRSSTFSVTLYSKMSFQLQARTPVSEAHVPRLPIPCKRIGTSVSTPSYFPPPSLLEERRAAREDRARPWLAGSCLTGASAPAHAAPEVTSILSPMEERRAARQDRPRPWAPAAPHCPPSTEQTASTTPAARGILRSGNGDRPVKSVRFGTKAVYSVDFWIERSRDIWPDPYG